MDLPHTHAEDADPEQQPLETGVTYRRRPVRMLRIAEIVGWQMKLYGISAHDDQPRTQLVDAAEHAASQHLPTPATADGWSGVGFVVAHDGEDAGWVLVCWWARELLHHVVLRSDPDAPGNLTIFADPTLTACTWELEVIAFEGDAWVAAQLSDVAQYLTKHLRVDV